MKKPLLITKVGKSFIPTDDLFKAIRKKLPYVAYSENQLPLIPLNYPKIRLQLKPFKEIYDDWFNELSEHWCNSVRKIHKKKGVLVFERKSEANAESQLAFSNLETYVKKFFFRWGFDCDCQFSLSKTKQKLHVSFKQTNERLPVIG